MDTYTRDTEDGFVAYVGAAPVTGPATDDDTPDAVAQLTRTLPMSQRDKALALAPLYLKGLTARQAAQKVDRRGYGLRTVEGIWAVWRRAGINPYPTGGEGPQSPANARKRPQNRKPANALSNE